jgi:hypothetical protein
MTRGCDTIHFFSSVSHGPCPLLVHLYQRFMQSRFSRISLFFSCSFARRISQFPRICTGCAIVARLTTATATSFIESRLPGTSRNRVRGLSFVENVLFCPPHRAIVVCLTTCPISGPSHNRGACDYPVFFVQGWIMDA